MAAVYDGRNVLWPSADPGRARNLGTVSLASWHVAATGDFDGDGRDDLFWRNDDDGRNALWRSANWTLAVRPATVANAAWSVAPFEAQPTMPLLKATRPAPIVEGNSGTQTVTVRLRLSHPAVFPVHLVMGADAGHVIGATPDLDFRWPASNLEPVFAPGETTLDLPITVLGDTAAEGNEPVFFWPVTVDEAFVFRFDGILTILNDDENTLWIDGAWLSDEFEGTRAMRFVIHLSRPQAREVTLVATTTTGSATAGVDYVAKSQRLTIPIGATEAFFEVDVIGDTEFDSWLRPERFGVQLSQVTGVRPVLSETTGFIVDSSYRRYPP